VSNPSLETIRSLAAEGIYRPRREYEMLVWTSKPHRSAAISRTTQPCYMLGRSEERLWGRYTFWDRYKCASPA
jgi:hypothetical protein